MKISIITVCYNVAESIEITIKSILSQDFYNYEYIIIDGNSKDGTKNIIEKYKSEFSKKNIEFIFISESDNGIYDAMNKGIKLASGEWLNFMNAGDQFHSSKVFKSVFNNECRLEDKVLVYGYKYQNDKVLYPKNIHVLRDGIIMANHQSMFFNKSILNEELLYDLRYPIYGDYELVNRIYLKYGSLKLKYLNLPIAIYEGGGISETPSCQKRKDKYLILLRNYGVKGVLKGLSGRLIK